MSNSRVASPLPRKQLEKVQIAFGRKVDGQSSSRLRESAVSPVRNTQMSREDTNMEHRKNMQGGHQNKDHHNHQVFKNLLRNRSGSNSMLQTFAETPTIGHANGQPNSIGDVAVSGAGDSSPANETPSTKQGILQLINEETMRERRRRSLSPPAEKKVSIAVSDIKGDESEAKLGNGELKSMLKNPQNLIPSGRIQQNFTPLGKMHQNPAENLGDRFQNSKNLGEHFAPDMSRVPGFLCPPRPSILAQRVPVAVLKAEQEANRNGGTVGTVESNDGSPDEVPMSTFSLDRAKVNGQHRDDTTNGALLMSPSRSIHSAQSAESITSQNRGLSAPGFTAKQTLDAHHQNFGRGDTPTSPVNSKQPSPAGSKGVSEQMGSNDGNGFQRTQLEANEIDRTGSELDANGPERAQHAGFDAIVAHRSPSPVFTHKSSYGDDEGLEVVQRNSGYVMYKMASATDEDWTIVLSPKTRAQTLAERTGSNGDYEGQGGGLSGSKAGDAKGGAASKAANLLAAGAAGVSKWFTWSGKNSKKALVQTEHNAPGVTPSTADPSTSAMTSPGVMTSAGPTSPGVITVSDNVSGVGDGDTLSSELGKDKLETGIASKQTSERAPAESDTAKLGKKKMSITRGVSGRFFKAKKANDSKIESTFGITVSASTDQSNTDKSKNNDGSPANASSNVRDSGKSRKGGRIGKDSSPMSMSAPFSPRGEPLPNSVIVSFNSFVSDRSRKSDFSLESDLGGPVPCPPVEWGDRPVSAGETCGLNAKSALSLEQFLDHWSGRQNKSSFVPSTDAVDNWLENQLRDFLFAGHSRTNSSGEEHSGQENGTHDLNSTMNSSRNSAVNTTYNSTSGITSTMDSTITVDSTLVSGQSTPDSLNWTKAGFSYADSISKDVNRPGCGILSVFCQLFLATEYSGGVMKIIRKILQSNALGGEPWLFGLFAINATLWTQDYIREAVVRDIKCQSERNEYERQKVEYQAAIEMKKQSVIDIKYKRALMLEEDEKKRAAERQASPRMRQVSSAIITSVKDTMKRIETSVVSTARAPFCLFWKNISPDERRKRRLSKEKEEIQRKLQQGLMGVQGEKAFKAALQKKSQKKKMTTGFMERCCAMLPMTRGRSKSKGVSRGMKGMNVTPTSFAIYKDLRENTFSEPTILNLLCQHMVIETGEIKETSVWDIILTTAQQKPYLETVLRFSPNSMQKAIRCGLPHVVSGGCLPHTISGGVPYAVSTNISAEFTKTRPSVLKLFPAMSGLAQIDLGVDKTNSGADVGKTLSCVSAGGDVSQTTRRVTNPNDPLGSTLQNVLDGKGMLSPTLSRNAPVPANGKFKELINALNDGDETDKSTAGISDAEPAGPASNIVVDMKDGKSGQKEKKMDIGKRDDKNGFKSGEKDGARGNAKDKDGSKGGSKSTNGSKDTESKGDSKDTDASDGPGTAGDSMPLDEELEEELFDTASSCHSLSSSGSGTKSGSASENSLIHKAGSHKASLHQESHYGRREIGKQVDRRKSSLREMLPKLGGVFQNKGADAVDGKAKMPVNTGSTRIKSAQATPSRSNTPVRAPVSPKTSSSPPKSNQRMKNPSASIPDKANQRPSLSATATKNPAAPSTQASSHSSQNRDASPKAKRPGGPSQGSYFGAKASQAGSVSHTSKGPNTSYGQLKGQNTFLVSPKSSFHRNRTTCESIPELGVLTQGSDGSFVESVGPRFAPSNGLSSRGGALGKAYNAQWHRSGTQLGVTTAGHTTASGHGANTGLNASGSFFNASEGFFTHGDAPTSLFKLQQGLAVSGAGSGDASRGFHGYGTGYVGTNSYGGSAGTHAYEGRSSFFDILREYVYKSLTHRLIEDEALDTFLTSDNQAVELSVKQRMILGVELSSMSERRKIQLAQQVIRLESLFPEMTFAEMQMQQVVRPEMQMEKAPLKEGNQDEGVLNEGGPIDDKGRHTLAYAKSTSKTKNRAYSEKVNMVNSEKDVNMVDSVESHGELMIGNKRKEGLILSGDTGEEPMGTGEESLGCDMPSNTYFLLTGHLYVHVLLRLCEWWLKEDMKNAADLSSMTNSYIRKTFLKSFKIPTELNGLTDLKNLNVQIARGLMKDAKEGSKKIVS